jgi:hypothetical protein
MVPRSLHHKELTEGSFFVSSNDLPLMEELLMGSKCVSQLGALEVKDYWISL